VLGDITLPRDQKRGLVLCALLPHAATIACRWLVLWDFVFVVKSCATVMKFVFVNHVLLYSTVV
jgi:hypothetical protein